MTLCTQAQRCPGNPGSPRMISRSLIKPKSVKSWAAGTEQWALSIDGTVLFSSWNTEACRPCSPRCFRGQSRVWASTSKKRDPQGLGTQSRCPGRQPGSAAQLQSVGLCQRRVCSEPAWPHPNPGLGVEAEALRSWAALVPAALQCPEPGEILPS